MPGALGRLFDCVAGAFFDCVSFRSEIDPLRPDRLSAHVNKSVIRRSVIRVYNPQNTDKYRPFGILISLFE